MRSKFIEVSSAGIERKEIYKILQKKKERYFITDLNKSFIYCYLM